MYYMVQGYGTGGGHALHDTVEDQGGELSVVDVAAGDTGVV